MPLTLAGAHIRQRAFAKDYGPAISGAVDSNSGADLPSNVVELLTACLRSDPQRPTAIRLEQMLAAVREGDGDQEALLQNFWQPGSLQASPTFGRVVYCNCPVAPKQKFQQQRWESIAVGSALCVFV
jgi:hypothetical protein